MNASFLERRLLLNPGLTLISSVIILVCIIIIPTIHPPYFIKPALAAGIGPFVQFYMAISTGYV